MCSLSPAQDFVSISLIYLSIYLSIYPPVCSSIRMSVFFIHPFIHLSCSYVPVHNLNSSYDFIQMVILKLFKEIVLKNTETLWILRYTLNFVHKAFEYDPDFVLFPMLTVFIKFLNVQLHKFVASVAMIRSLQAWIYMTASVELLFKWGLRRINLKH